METYLDQALFKELLQETGLLSVEDMLFAEQKAHTDEKSLPTILIELGLLSKQEITKIIALTQGVSFVDLTNKILTPDVLESIPEPISRSHNFVCFQASDDQLDIACVDLDSISHIQEMYPDKKIVPYLTDNASVTGALKKYQKHLSETFGEQISSSLGRMRDPESFQGLEEHLPVDYHTEIAEDISTEKVVRNLIVHAEVARATHIYITPTGYDTDVSYRIDGVLYEAMKLPADALSSIIIKLRHMVDLPIIDVKKAPGVSSGFAVFDSVGHKISLQVLFFNTPLGNKAVIRLMPEGTLFDAVETLITSKTQQEYMYKQLSNSPLVLVSGAAGFGTTRTYYGLLEHLSTKNTEVMSLEHPIETVLSGITQISVTNKQNEKRVLQQALAARPDVLGFSPFVLGSHASVLAATRSGISVVAEIGKLGSFVTDLGTSKLLSGPLLSSIGLVVVHQVFNAVDENEKKTHTLTKDDIAHVRKYMTDGEIMAFLHHEGVINEKMIHLADVKFTVRKKINKKKRVSPVHEKLYVRGVFGMKEVIAKLGDQNPTKVVLQKHVRVSEKRAILENVLLRSIAGEICFKDIQAYLNN